MKYSALCFQLSLALGALAKNIPVRRSDCSATPNWQRVSCQAGFTAMTCFEYDAAKEVANNCKNEETLDPRTP